ncbi:MAG TPA: hypothetical protein VEQ58_23495 [Polyangiaceae bacterium]|nr:hypothetical protein [Polyangiaceae bacterium]
MPTPRGGFMARPGLKMPPRHAVVVRGGNAAVTDEIPVARSSCPPPAPTSQPVPSPRSLTASSEKVTLPAIPRFAGIEALSDELTPPKLETLLPPPPDSAPRAWGPRALESVPPPSDAPVANSVRPAPAAAPRRRSSWAIVAAAAIGLLLGLVSIATTTGSRSSTPAPAAQPVAQELPVLAPLPSPPPSSEVAAVSSASLPQPAALQPARPAQQSVPSRKKSIF